MKLENENECKMRIVISEDGNVIQIFNQNDKMFVYNRNN